MADEKEAPASPWAPFYFLLLIIIGALAILYVRGDLKNLHSKDLLTPPPQESAATTSDTTIDEQGNTYGGRELQQNAYTMDPNPLQVTDEPAQ